MSNNTDCIHFYLFNDLIQKARCDKLAADSQCLIYTLYFKAEENDLSTLLSN